MRYIRQHWNGELPLAIAFWVNVFLLGILLRLFELWLDQSLPVEHPVTISRIAVAYFAFTVLIAYPWQIVGVWRSSDRYSKQPNSGIWGGVVRVLVVLGLLGTAGNLSQSLPVYSDLLKIGFGPDEYADYRLSVTDDGSLIHLNGGLGFGVSGDFADLLAENDSITGVILDSRGGRLYEGRALANIILKHGLDTYSITGCYSACGTAYVAGSRRYLSLGANLAFHQYKAPGEAISLYFDVGTEQQKDLQIYRSRGISEDFLQRIFLAENDDLWYPTVEELTASGVVHDFVKPSDLQTADYGDFTTSELYEEIEKFPVFNTIRTYEPAIYAELVGQLEQNMRAGASMIEMQATVATYVRTLADKSLPITSNSALIAYTGATVGVLQKLEAIEPILCLQNLFPAQYGTVNIMKHLSQEDLIPMMEALGLVVSDRYGYQPPELDAMAAESTFSDVVDEMGDAVNYLNAPSLNTRQEYSEACRAVIQFYELILERNDDVAANALRYAFSP